MNGKKYIGLTTGSMADRFSAHKSDAKRGLKTPLCRAFQKYGFSQFVIDELVRASSIVELNELEEKLIRQFKTAQSAFGYNARLGGLGHRCTEETKLKIGNANRGRKLPPRSLEQREKARLKQLGKKHSEETKLKMRKPKRRAPHV